jgi:hypothetical protein
VEGRKKGGLLDNGEPVQLSRTLLPALVMENQGPDIEKVVLMRKTADLYSRDVKAAIRAGHRTLREFSQICSALVGNCTILPPSRPR